VTRKQSHEWQLEASLSDGDFDAWLDGRLQSGLELTASSLRAVARHMRGKPAGSGELEMLYRDIRRLTGSRLAFLPANIAGPVRDLLLQAAGLLEEIGAGAAE
jgi:hypothetical protein